MKHYKLLTPGPLTTTKTVKESMLYDWCTWEIEYKDLVQKLRERLLSILEINSEIYTVALMQGSGTFSVESTLMSSLSKKDKILVLSNGAYGDRIIEILKKANKNYIDHRFLDTQIIDKNITEKLLKENQDVTHLIFVHCETTTGILNPLEEICTLAYSYKKKIIVDAMSSLGGVKIDIEKNNIDFIISSANKCIQGVPGFGFIILKKENINHMKDNSPSLSLDLYEQLKVMDDEKGKWRFTSPTHVVRAFYQALLELEKETLKLRIQRYKKNQRLLVQEMEKIGFETAIENKHQSPIITTFLYYKHKNFSFEKLYNYLKNSDFVIYPGKLSSLKVFRIGNIGEIYEDDILKLTKTIQLYIKEELK